MIVTHDNPDPDGIASGWAVAVLVKTRLARAARLVARGAIVRAENVRMLELLAPPLELVTELATDPHCGLLLVDCRLSAANHLLSQARIRPCAVIDHHSGGGYPPQVAYADIRPRAAASASIVTGYLREQQIEPTAGLATALLYAIRTETQGRGVVFTRADLSAVSWLTDRADHAKLADIENAPLPRRYFGDLLAAIESTFVYEGSAFCFLSRASGPETAGEIADLLVRCNQISRVLCAVVVEPDLFVSVRTTERGGSARALVHQTVEGLGDGGGHPHRAGGRISGVRERMGNIEQLESLVRTRWLAACGVHKIRGTRLVARKEILEHL